MIEIQEINKEKDIDNFIRFEKQVYEKYPLSVPPIIQQVKFFLSGKSVFFQHCEHKMFVALKDNHIVATMAAFFDKNLIKYYNDDIGLIGYMEALPGQDEALSMLFEQAEEFLRNKGTKIIWAPFNGNILYGLALLGDAYNESPFFLMPYNPPYYHSYFWKNGYKKFKDILAFTVDMVDIRLQRKINYINRHAQKSRIKIRAIDLKNLRQEILCLAKIYNETFKNHWGYVPQSEEELFETVEPFRVALEKEFILFAEDGDKTIGFVLCVPDYNFIIKKLKGDFSGLKIFSFFRLKKRITKARLIAIGVLESYRGQNIAPLLIARAFDAMVKKGYTTVEYSWVLAENVSSQGVICKFYGKVNKHYTVYQKQLNS